ncbi:MAG: hypothetical protein IPL75_13285 [Acidobacteria bacterium]|nr:hypothetical protein [Acidobacteriota bacterium]
MTAAVSGIPPILIRPNQAAQLGVTPSVAKKLAAHPQALRRPRSACGGEVRDHRSPSGKAREKLFCWSRTCSHNGYVNWEHRDVNRPVRTAVSRIDGDARQFLRRLHRQRAQAHGIDQLEDRRIGSHTEGERQDSDDREKAVPAALAPYRRSRQ